MFTEIGTVKVTVLWMIGCRLSFHNSQYRNLWQLKNQLKAFFPRCLTMPDFLVLVATCSTIGMGLTLASFQHFQSAKGKSSLVYPNGNK